LRLANDEYRPSVQLGRTPDDGLVVPEIAVTVDFLEICEGARDIVQGVRALGMPGELDFLPRGEVGVDFLDLLLDLLLGGIHFPVEVQVILRRHAPEVVVAVFKFPDGLFEIENECAFAHGVGL
jgi:hypothetical protein